MMINERLKTAAWWLTERVRTVAWPAAKAAALVLAFAAGQATAQSSALAADAELVSGNHPVIEAIIAGDTAAVRVLLDKGLEPNGKYEFQHPRWNDGKPTKMSLPLAAGMFGRLDIAKMVYNHRGFRGSKIGNTEVLCMSISHRHPDLALYAIEKDAYANSPGGCFGWFTPLSRAKELEMDEVVSALKKSGG